ncbi:MAG: hypothetical protein WC360_04215 [Opitutales bacterium]|jgi:hypothetical protein
MKVTAFYLANKVEEAARSYFSNSFVFSSRTIDVERSVDFRLGRASLQFFVHVDEQDRIPMGGMVFASVQEKDNKAAFQCRYHILPSGESKEFFLMMGADSEQYVHYSNLAQILRKHWEKKIDAYLPKGEEVPVMSDQPQSVEDEYDSLSPEEIEAITGVRPEPKAAAPAAVASKEPTSVHEQASEDEIQRLMGMMMGGGAQEPPSGPTFSMDEIEALTREAQQKDAGRGRKSDADDKPATEESDIMSAEDIWKQISGG